VLRRTAPHTSPRVEKKRQVCRANITARVEIRAMSVGRRAPGFEQERKIRRAYVAIKIKIAERRCERPDIDGAKRADARLSE
jgi:hypothetical protein